MLRPETPLLTVDVIIQMNDHPGRIVLIERRHEPLGWALPGGFVDVGETIEQAAVREAFEETGLAVTLTALLGVYSDPARDPRGHTCSVVFLGEAWGQASAGDDAANAGIFDPAEPPPLAFDHQRIIEDFLRFRDHGERPPLASTALPGSQGA